MRSSATSKFGGSYTDALIVLFLGVVSSGRFFFFLPNTLELRCLVGWPGESNTPLSERLMGASSSSTVTPTADARTSPPAGIEGRPASETAGKEGKSPLNAFGGGSSPSRAWELNARNRNAMVQAQRRRARPRLGMTREDALRAPACTTLCRGRGD